MVTFPVLQSSLDFGICVCIHSCVWRSGVSLEIISREAAHVAFGDSISPWDWTPWLSSKLQGHCLSPCSQHWV